MKLFGGVLSFPASVWLCGVWFFHGNRVTTTEAFVGIRPLTTSVVRTRFYAPLRSETVSQPQQQQQQQQQEEQPLWEPFMVGIVRDYKARLPYLKSDVTDGLNTQCLAAILFLFFACLAPAVGFGALFGEVTQGAIGTMEMVTSTAACGMIYALCSAQPLTIIGSTGPVLAFVATLVKLAHVWSVPFLPLYAWTGIWTSAILGVLSVFSGSHWVKYLTRFTDEIFSVLISVIFAVEACTGVALAFSSASGTTFATALTTLLCASLTFGMATWLKGVRNTKYFNSAVRQNLSNFAPTLAVATSAWVARWIRLSQTVALSPLQIPPTFATTTGRPWRIPLGQLPVWARWASFLPALMATVLLYLDQNITVRVVNNPRYKMKKGRREKNVLDGMNADLLIISILTFLQSLVGLPWLVAATVRSISHVRSLSVLDDSNNNSPKIVGTREQRVTGLSIHALIGCAILFHAPRQLLAQVPRPVLSGLFLFLGTSALPGNEMWERTLGAFQEGFTVQSVSTRVVNAYTLIQWACLAAMFFVKESPIGVLFPVVIALLAPLRFALTKFGIISTKDMDILDKED